MYLCLLLVIELNCILQFYNKRRLLRNLSTIVLSLLIYYYKRPYNVDENHCSLLYHLNLRTLGLLIRLPIQPLLRYGYVPLCGCALIRFLQRLRCVYGCSVRVRVLLQCECDWILILCLQPSFLH